MRQALTTRQRQILEAVRSRGSATLLDLRDDFPDLAPSAVARVLDALGAREMVERSGDPALIYLGGVEFRSTGAVHAPSVRVWSTRPQREPLPRLYLDHRADQDIFSALEFGRTVDGQDPDGWRDVCDKLSYLNAGAAGREVGFGVNDFSSFDVEDPENELIWSGPRFDVPVLGLAGVTAGEIILAARVLFGDAPSVNRWFFDEAVCAKGERALELWLGCLQAGDPTAHFGVGYTLFDLGRFPEAYRHLRHYTEIAPHGSWPWCWRGQAAEAIGELAEARVAYARAIEIEGEGGDETDADERLEAIDAA